jgi:hypothetical protein
VSRAAGEIERLARAQTVEGASDQFTVLQEELERLFLEIEVLHKG